MTNLEAFRKLIKNDSVSDADIIDELSLNGVDALQEWGKDCDFYRALIELKLTSEGMLNGIRSESEGGYSISYDKSNQHIQDLVSRWAYQSKCSSLIKDFGIKRPTITGIDGMKLGL